MALAGVLPARAASSAPPTEYSATISAAVIGAIRHDGTGAAYVFTRSGATWSQQAELTAADAADYDYFGDSIALRTLVAGAPGHNDVGAAYVFSGSGAAWSEVVELTAPDAAAGNSPAVSGGRVLPGSPGNSFSTGAAYVFSGALIGSRADTRHPELSGCASSSPGSGSCSNR